MQHGLIDIRKLSREELLERGLFKQSFKVDLPAGEITSGEFTVIAMRGDVQAIGIVCAGGTEENYIDTAVTLSNNGRSFIDNDNLLPYSSNYRSEEKSVVPVYINEKGIVNFNFNNTSAAALKVSIQLYFYNPFSEYYRG